MKIKKIDIAVCLFICLCFFIAYSVLNKYGFLWGYNTDWIIQHVTFPDYFRKLFYTNFDLFPDFAFNLGGGQNIYNFAYYGYLNPFVIISYLLPFIEMINWIQFISIINVIISAILLYFYLKRKFNFLTSLTGVFLFLTAGPIVFHSHHHIMFVNYLPFLILSFYGVDRYLEKNKLDLLIISLFFIMFSSYYYSMGSLCSIFIYYIYQFVKLNKKITKQEIKKLLLPFIVSILMASLLILPTAYTLLSGRTTNSISANIVSLLTPKKNLSYILYDEYSIGLSVISLVSIVYLLLEKKKENRFLSIVLLLFSIFPIFNYLLNGTIYIDSKSLIPFIPLCIVYISDFFFHLYKNKINHKKLFISIFLVFLFTSNSKVYWELLILIFVFLVFYKYRNIKIIIVYLLFMNIYFSFKVNINDHFLNNNFFNESKFDESYSLIKDMLSFDQKTYRINNLISPFTTVNYITSSNELKTSIYSSLNNDKYSDFVFDIANNYFSNINMLKIGESINPLFNTFMGVKYVVSDNFAPFNSEIVNENNGVKVYKNNNVLPIGYASSSIITNEQFNELNYPSTMVNLLNNIIVEDYENVNKTINIEKIDLDYNIIESNNIVLDKNNNRIIADKNASLKLKLKNKLEDEILFIRITTSNYPTCSNNNLAITINGITNRKTCETYRYRLDNNTFDYAIYDNDELNITFTKNNYDIESVEFYLLDYSLVDNLNDKVDEFVFDKDKTKGDYIVGDINVTNDGYFTLSIPYDKGFKIKVDGQSVDYEKVNTSFIGFPISKGNHHIEIEYEAPLKKVGMLLSIIGFGCYFIIIYKQKKKII